MQPDVIMPMIYFSSSNDDKRAQEEQFKGWIDR